MVDISTKSITYRTARAEGRVRLKAEILERILQGTLEKGDILATIRLAGILAAKKTPDLIPLCHPLRLTKVEIDIQAERDPCGLCITAFVSAEDRTGVEMEALTAVTMACLTLYDMVKSLDHSLIIEHIVLLEKSGGKSGSWRREYEWKTPASSGQPLEERQKLKE